jgi:hypothetical protein
MLRIRDGKTRGIVSGGILKKLTDGWVLLIWFTLIVELIRSAKNEGGYPDSDDEDEEADDVEKQHHEGVRYRRTSAKRTSNIFVPKQESEDHSPSLSSSSTSEKISTTWLSSFFFNPAPVQKSGEVWNQRLFIFS